MKAFIPPDFVERYQQHWLSDSDDTPSTVNVLFDYRAESAGEAIEAAIAKIRATPTGETE